MVPVAVIPSCDSVAVTPSLDSVAVQCSPNLDSAAVQTEALEPSTLIHLFSKLPVETHKFYQGFVHLICLWLPQFQSQMTFYAMRMDVLTIWRKE